MENSVLFAFLLTLLAGLSTGVGSLIGLMSKKFNPKILTLSLGFSAGVMIYVSMVEIFDKAKISLIETLGEREGYITTVISFFAGIFIIALIDKLIPNYENPHELNVAKKIENSSEKEKSKLLRMGVFSALAIGIHNFPEGLATFMSALSNPTLGISIAIAIAIHNIPEGLAVSAPIFYATKSRKKAFIFSFLSGLAEPIGALVGYFILRPFFTETTFGIIFASVAGIMIYISLDELLPTAEEYGEHHIAIGGLILGMIVIAISLILFM
ncbi:zinc transporter ZupT [Thiospirochaeta perfilievii]|uniref:Zinc transporter ZupT n=1 Tax=Thiospirochaeta perfilievii TaxID=252967 RepID=A0A5C1QB46_9SPIO|nr:zinc transporter ZupT [Thiospirochaeta perfilievii]QEN04741.1 zinc transporter ZupT [Thiospirochaeta perfilievii]